MEMVPGQEQVLRVQQVLIIHLLVRIAAIILLIIVAIIAIYLCARVKHRLRRVHISTRPLHLNR
jgi:hypothetical protein